MMSYGRMLLPLLLAAGLAGASSCSSYSTQDYGPVPVTAIKVTPQTVQITTIGGTAQLVAAVGPIDATDRAVSWESTNPAIASVDATGKVTAHAAGAEVFVTAITHDGHLQSSANVSVVP
jgi:uncharacterized protein YjdB